MSTTKHSWTRLLRLRGPDYLAWLTQNAILQKKLNTLSNALWTVLCACVHKAEHAIEVWKVVPSVVCRCNEQDTYERPGASVAYAWLYLLERYVRTWLALEVMVERSCLPMAKYGVRTLDVGSGPGPSAFAVHDFFAAMTEFSNLRGNINWRQPPQITCVELSSSTNHVRHVLAEKVFEQSQGRSKGVLAMCRSLHDFGEIMPTIERKRVLTSMRNEVDDYYDEVLGMWASDVRYMPDEASAVAQSLHRYRLFVLSNFLTTSETVETFRSNLVDIMEDAAPGSVIMTLGGRGTPYPQIYDKVDEIARSAGFQQTIVAHDVSIKNSLEEDLVYHEGKRFYEYLQDLAQNPSDDKCTQDVCSHFEGRRAPVTPSRLIAYKKYRNRR